MTARPETAATAARTLRSTLRIEDVSPAGFEVRIDADEAARGALAKELDLLSIDRLAARLHAVPEGRGTGLRVTGEVAFRVVHRCVVTLEPVAQEGAEPVDVAYVSDRVSTRRGTEERAPPAAERAATVEVGEADPPELAPGGVVDLGALVEEHLALALDPYPRSPGASFAEPAPATDEERPFAGLAALRDRLGKG